MEKNIVLYLFIKKKVEKQKNREIAELFSSIVLYFLGMGTLNICRLLSSFKHGGIRKKTGQFISL